MKVFCHFVFLLLSCPILCAQPATDSTTVGDNGTSTVFAPCTEILRFDSYNDATAGSSSGQDFVFALGNGGTLSFNLKRTNAPVEAVTAPCWSGAEFGQYDYTGLQGKVILYQLETATNTNFFFDSIVLKDYFGNIISDYTMTVFDAEATDPGEVSTLAVPPGFTWYDWDSMVPAAPYSIPIETGTGTDTLRWTGTSPQDVNNKSYSVAVNSAPTLSVSFVHTNTGYQALALGIKRTIRAINDTFCSEGTVNINLLNAASGTTYTWPLPLINPPGSVSGATAQNVSASAIAQTLSNTTNNTATLTYTITPASCFSIDSPFTVQVIVYPKPVLNLGNDTSPCSNQPVILNATTQGASYTWQDGSSSPTDTVTQTGTYSVTVTLGGCSASDSIHINFGLPPVTISSNADTICPSDSAMICAPIGYASYAWNVGTPNRCINVQYAGNYYVSVTDNSGCSVESNHLSIIVRQAPPVSISGTGDTMRVYDATNIQWYLNSSPINGATQDVYIAQTLGSYTVSVTDSNGCTTFSSPVVFTGIAGISYDENIFIYPNPLSIGNWQLEVGNNLLGSVIEILDDNGRVVYKAKITNTHSEINAQFAGGIYLLRITTGAGVVLRKLVKLQ